MNPCKFELARQLSDLAVEVDESKPEFDAVLAGQFLDCALAMHKMAELLAGKRSTEIYSNGADA